MGNCYVKGSRVDLYKLKEASPGLFKNVKLGVKSDKNKEKKSKKDDKKEKERKISSDKKVKKEKKPKPATSTKIVSLALISSDSDSDSDLEEMKKRLMKPGVISSSTSSKPSTINAVLKKPSSSEAPKKPSKLEKSLQNQ